MMDEGLAAPCLELGRAEHDALRWMTRKSNKRGVVPLDQPTLAEQLNRMVFHGGVSPYAVLIHLHDGGYIRKLDGEGFEVLQPCYGHEEKVGEDYQGGRVRLRTPSTIARSAVVDSRSGSPSGEPRSSSEFDSRNEFSTAVRPANIRSIVPGLVSYFFDSAIAAGLMHQYEIERGGLGRNLQIWTDNGMSVALVKDMVREFCQHPEWVRKSAKRYACWQVFIHRRPELLRLVAHAHSQSRNKDWLNWSDTTRHKDWLGRHTPPSYSVP